MHPENVTPEPEVRFIPLSELLDGLDPAGPLAALLDPATYGRPSC